jgi:hypothetical protein
VHLSKTSKDLIGVVYITKNSMIAQKKKKKKKKKNNMRDEYKS